MTRQRLKDLVSLARRKGRTQHGQFLVEGVRSVEAAIDADAPLVELLVTEPTAQDGRVQALLARASCPVHSLPAADLSRVTDVQHGQGIAAVAHAIVQDDLAVLGQARTVVVLDGVQDPGNVGTLIRTAAWFGIEAVVVGPGTADPESPKVVRSAMGGLWDLALVRAASVGAVLDRLAERGLPIWGADLQGESASSWTPPADGVLVMGSEGHGLSEDAAQRLTGRVQIRSAQDGTRRGVESLNVALAGGILLHQWRGGAVG